MIENLCKSPAAQYRVLGVLSLACFTISLFIGEEEGLRVLELGWLGPVGAGFSIFAFFNGQPLALLSVIGSCAWYANILLAILVFQLLCGRKPNFTFALYTSCLAFTGLGPTPKLSPSHGFEGLEFIPGVYILYWLTAFLLTLVPYLQEDSEENWSSFFKKPVFSARIVHVIAPIIAVIIVFSMYAKLIISFGIFDYIASHN